MKKSGVNIREMHKQGFALLFVIIIMTLIAVVTFMLTEDAKTILFHSNRAYLKAVERDLIASGLAWSMAQLRDSNAEVLNTAVELDVTEVSLPYSILKIKIISSANSQPEVEIITSCSRARQTFNHEQIYRID
jgi:type II secretory pathway component PulK